jgi:hypothetical protein
LKFSYGGIIRNSSEILEVLLVVAKANKPEGLLKLYKKFIPRFEALATVFIEV